MSNSLKYAVLLSAFASTAAFADTNAPAQKVASAPPQLSQAQLPATAAGGASSGAPGTVSGTASAVAGGVAAAGPAIGLFAAAAAVGNAMTRGKAGAAISHNTPIPVP